MKLPDPTRFAYFPPTSIFGKNLIPIYYDDEFGSTVPVKNVAEALGVSAAKLMKIVISNGDAINMLDASTGKAISPGQKLANLQDRLCIGMDGISLVIMNIDHSQIKDPLTRERISVAKKWLAAQISNRVKSPGQKHQPRWDSGLDKNQAKLLKARIARLKALERKK